MPINNKKNETIRTSSKNPPVIISSLIIKLMYNLGGLFIDTHKEV